MIDIGNEGIRNSLRLKTLLIAVVTVASSWAGLIAGAKIEELAGRTSQKGGKQMKLRTFAAQAALAAVVAIAAPGAGFAQSSDCKTLIKPSPFGPDDQTGASNRVPDAVTKAAAAEIKTGEKVSMT